MKVFNKQAGNALNAYKIAGQQKAKIKEKKSDTKQIIADQKSRDTLTLSDNVWEYQVAHKTLDKTPNLRIEKINGIKKRIGEGNYDVDGLLVAEKIIERYSVDKLI